MSRSLFGVAVLVVRVAAVEGFNGVRYSLQILIQGFDVFSAWQVENLEYAFHGVFDHAIKSGC